MNKKIIYILSSILMVLALMLATSVYAENANETGSEDVVANQEDVEEAGAVEDALGAEEIEMDGIEIEEVAKPPSRWGLLWRGVKERVSLITTLDPVKKAEKQLKFSEERMRIAEILSEKVQDPKMQARAEKMIKRSHKLMEKVDKNKGKWMKDAGERAEKLLKNIATHQITRERVMDVLEEKIPPERLEKLHKLREKGLEGGKRLLDALKNENIPDKIREHLQNVKNRVDTHSEEVKKFQEAKKQLLDDAKNGDEEAQKKLDDLKDDRKENIKNRIDEYKEKMEEWRSQAKEGKDGAADKLNRIGIVKERLKEKFEEKKQEKQDGEASGDGLSGDDDGKVVKEEWKSFGKKVQQAVEKRRENIQEMRNKDVDPEVSTQDVPSEGAVKARLPQNIRKKVQGDSQVPKVEPQKEEAWKVEEAE